MFDTTVHSVNVPKRDLLSIVANVPPGSLNGCKWCGKTILWNGGTWVHVNDRPACSYIACKMEWAEGKTEPIEVIGLFRTRTEQSPVGRCSRCLREDAAYHSSYRGGGWMLSGRSECPAAVATPVNVAHEVA